MVHGDERQLKYELLPYTQEVEGSDCWHSYPLGMDILKTLPGQPILCFACSAQHVIAQDLINDTHAVHKGRACLLEGCLEALKNV